MAGWLATTREGPQGMEKRPVGGRPDTKLGMPVLDLRICETCRLRVRLCAALFFFPFLFGIDSSLEEVLRMMMGRFTGGVGGGRASGAALIGRRPYASARHGDSSGGKRAG